MNRTSSVCKSPSVVLAFVVVLTLLLAGCGSTSETATTPQANATAAPQGAATTAPQGAGTTAPQGSSAAVKITAFAPQGDQPLATNSFTSLVEQKFNIKFTWQTTTFDSVSAHEKRQIALASGDYPDLFLLIPWVDQFSQLDLLRYGQQRVLIPLNDLIDQYAPHVKDALAKYPYFKAQAVAPDGKIYGIPQLIECYHCSYIDKLWINSAWLKKLNLQMPKTPDDLKAVLEAFKTKDPNGNGKADEVPLSGAGTDDPVLPFLMDPFIYYTSDYLLLNNGKVDISANKPEYKQGLTYVRSLYAEKLIDPGGLTQNRDALGKLGNTASANVLGAATVLHPYEFVAANSPDGRDKQYDPVPPLTGPNGTAYATYRYPSAPGGTFVLTNKASKEAQIAAVKLLDYMFTEEGQIRGHFGEEGVDWRKPQPGDKPVEEGATPLLAQIPAKSGDPPRNTNWGAMAQYFQPKAFRDSWVQAVDIYSQEGYERRLQEATHLYDGHAPKELYPLWAVWIDPAAASEAATLRTNIENYIGQNSLQFVTGSKDPDKDWDAYVAGLDKLNVKRYLEIMQQAYDKMPKQ